MVSKASQYIRVTALRSERYAQKIKYVPAESLHIVGSCTEMSPVTYPGFGWPTASAVKARREIIPVSMT